MHPFARIALSPLLLVCLFLSAADAALAAFHEKYRAFYRDRWVEYVEQDGRAITEGDILLGSAADLARLRDGGTGPKALVVDQSGMLWPIGPSGAHEVPYVFDAGPQGSVEAAVAQFNAAFAGIIQWVPHSTQADYVSFNLAGQSGSCFSSVGRVGGKQLIGGSPTCPVGSLLHEMGHAIGFWHTQSDPAQGSFLRILYETMDPLWRSQYRPIVDSRAIDGYDYASIMHYGPFVQSTTPDVVSSFTIPPGIDIGQRAAYSASDADAIRRLYGGTPAVVTIDTNPSGLQVIVDGAVRTGPATFNWRLGSLHRLDVPPGLQASGAFRFAFGRWNHDPAANPTAAQEWIVAPGQGFLGQPPTAPRSTVLVANFVRLVQVQPFVSGGQFGSLTTTAESPPWPGTTDYYPQFTKFDFAAAPNPGYLNTWFASSSYSLTGGTGGVASASRRIAAFSPQLLGGTLFTGQAIVVQTAGPGVDGTLRANITAPGSTQPVTTAIPAVLRSTAAGTYTIAADASLARTDSVRFALQTIDGLDNGPSGSIVMPDPGEPARLVTVNFQQQFQAVVQRRPTCGGIVTLSRNTTWLPFGSALTATATPAAGVTFAGWGGTLTGSGPAATMTVDRVPEVVANFNVLAEPFTVSGVAPATYVPGQGPVTFQFSGTGFSPAMFLALEGGTRKSGDAPDSHTFRVTLADADLPRTGKIPVTPGVGLGAGCTLFADAIAIDVLPRIVPQPITVFEFYNAALDRYFRTASAEEAAAIRANPATGEQDTGQIFSAWSSTAHPAGATPVFRFYGSVNPGPNSHFFTAAVDEARQLQRAELDTPASGKRWNYEELAFAIEPAVAGGCPAEAPVRIYRAYNNGFARGKDSNHRLLTDFGLYAGMIAQGWAGEGVVMCGPQ